MLVGAVRAIAVIVVDAESGHADGWVADACEGIGVFVVLCNCCVWISRRARLIRSRQAILLLSRSRLSQPLGWTYIPG